MEKSKEKFTIITAGGIGTRMLSTRPKQFSLLAGIPVLMHTIKHFADYDADMTIFLTLPADEIDFWEQLCKEHDFNIPHKKIHGGKSRFESVRNVVEMLPLGGYTAVHDGVRPLVAQSTIEAAFLGARKTGVAVPVYELPFSLRKVQGKHSEAIDRNSYRQVQTPQVFKTQVLKQAYQLPYRNNFTDDATVAEAAGYKVYLTDGNQENIKITYPSDLIAAEAVMKNFSG